MVRKVIVEEGQYEDSAAIVADGWNGDAGINNPEALAGWLEAQDIVLEEAVTKDGSAMSDEGWYRIVPKEVEPTMVVTQEQMQALLDRAAIAVVLSLNESGVLEDAHGVSWLDDNKVILTQGKESDKSVVVSIVPKEGGTEGA